MKPTGGAAQGRGKRPGATVSPIDALLQPHKHMAHRWLQRREAREEEVEGVAF
jgi:hypothetical protein